MGNIVQINDYFLALMQRALKKQDQGNRGKRKLTTTLARSAKKWGNFRGGEPPINRTRF